MKMKDIQVKVVRWSVVAIFACIAFVLTAGTLDWFAKYQMYLSQRNALYEAINAGEDYEAIKKTVSYLQGTATRSLNALKHASLTFSVCLAAAVAMWWSTIKTKGD